jgi:glucokinase
VSVKEPAETTLRVNIAGALMEAIGRSGLTRQEVAGIGMGLPGNLRPDEGLCVFSPNFQWRDVQVRAPLQEELGIPVFIQNDVRTITLGEKHFGLGRGVDSFVCVWLGTGVGGGIVINGQLYTGSSESAGEIGHITVNPEGPLCNCGNRGCLESYASGTGMARRTAELLVRESSPILEKVVEKRGKTSAAGTYEAAVEGDEAAIRLWEDMGTYLGIGLGNIVTTVNPRMVIVGGRVSDAWDFFSPAMIREFESRVHMVPKGFTQIVRSTLGVDAGILGGAALARERLG